MTTNDAFAPLVDGLQERLELFFGGASDALAYVYARLEPPDGTPAAKGLSLAGSLHGPHCQYAATLPARFALVDRGAGPSLLAAATIPEPCFWTPDLPHLYRADVELRRGAQVLARASRSFGMRTLGAAGGKLIYDATRWVLRGVRRDHVPATSLAEWRQARAAMVVSAPTDELCEAASRDGVLLVAALDTPNAHELRRLSRWPAVGMVVLTSPDPGSAAAASLPKRPDGAGPNLLLAVHARAQDPAPIPEWVDVVLVDVTSPGDLAVSAGKRQPALIAVRSGGALANLADARAACDQLQRDLAAHAGRARYDWSGYIV